MKYYVVADPHGFCTVLRQTLEEAGFFTDPEPHKLIVCGDLLDRGSQAVATVELMLSLLEQDRLIYISGNHEDLLIRCLQDIARGEVCDIAFGSSHHRTNGTWDTLLQLSGMNKREAVDFPLELVYAVRGSDYYRRLLPVTRDFFETSRYVFCHGWIPSEMNSKRRYRYRPDWRQADGISWWQAKWLNGMDLACRDRVLVPDKTVVCGHFHTSYGHAVYEKKGDEWGKNADFSPFCQEGILALDACAAHSGRINCVVLEDD